MAKQKTVKLGDLNWKQTKFVENYISNGGNATVAYIDAGFSKNGARQGASRLLTNVDIIEAIAIERERLQTILNFNREHYFRIQIGIATARISDFAPLFKNHTDRENYKSLGHKEYALKSVKASEYGTEIQLCERQAALNELWTKFGLGESGNKGNWFDGLDELMELIKKTKTGGTPEN